PRFTGRPARPRVERVRDAGSCGREVQVGCEQVGTHGRLRAGGDACPRDARGKEPHPRTAARRARTRRRCGEAVLLARHVLPRAYPATTSALRITTSSVGTFSWPLRLAVGTPLMRSTTSPPSTTLPNTV